MWSRVRRLGLRHRAHPWQGTIRSRRNPASGCYEALIWDLRDAWHLYALEGLIKYTIYQKIINS